MAKKKKTLLHSIHEKHFSFTKNEIGLFFLGVGLTMFLLNIASMINSIQAIIEAGKVVKYPFMGFYISLLSSMLLMIYSLYNIYEQE